MHSLIPAVQASHFYRRWLQGAPERAAALQDASAEALTPERLAMLLERQLQQVPDRDPKRAMRQLRNLTMCVLIERDLDGRASLDEVCRTMTALAELAISRHLAVEMAELTAIHGVPIGAESRAPQEMMVIGMGKLGGGELNVSSDIDLIFIYPESGDTEASVEGQSIRPLSNHEFFIRLGRRLIAALSEITQDGFTFRVDMALRPNGGSGPLAANFAMLEDYLITQGRDWERYAWCKARAITGEPADIETLSAIYLPFVYRRYLDYGSIDALRAMHRQIRAEVLRQENLHPERDTNVKLGRGGIREIEFLAQVFQLIRGGRDADLRDRSTRATLRTLADKNLLTPEMVDSLLCAYTFLRQIEHRLQYLDDAQTHVLPPSIENRTLIAASAGMPDVAALLADMNQHRQLVAHCFDDIFSNPAETSTSPDQTEQQDDPDLLSGDPENLAGLIAMLNRWQLQEPQEVARRLQAMARSQRIAHLPEVSRTRLAHLLTRALPTIAALPGDHALVAGRLLDFLEAIARRAAYLALLTEYPHALTRVIGMMAASGWTATYLSQHPIVLDELLDERLLHEAQDWDVFKQYCQRQLEPLQGDTERQMDVLRELHHAQLFRLLAQDLEGSLSVEQLADQLSMLADIMIDVTLRAVWRAIPNTHRPVPSFAVIAYGKLGGKELGYASDLDLVFIFDDSDPEAPALYAKLAQRFITWMTSMTSAGILFDIDIALRPDGASGLLTASMANFEQYQHQSAWVWEHQALTRARFCAGDPAIGQHFETLRENVLRTPRDQQSLRTEVLTMRERMHAAHPNRSQLFDIKHDSGGMIDIEFMVQYLVLAFASQYPQLTADIGNIALLKLAGSLGLAQPALTHQVADAYRTYRARQHTLRLHGDSTARSPAAPLASEIDAVQRLWKDLFNI